MVILLLATVTDGSLAVTLVFMKRISFKYVCQIYIQVSSFLHHSADVTNMKNRVD